MIETVHIVLAMKPLEGNFVENAKHHGTAGINIDASRISGPKGDGVWGTSNKTVNRDRKFNASPDMGNYRSEAHTGGRWPANVILVHSPGCKLIGTKKVEGEKPRGLKNTEARSWKNQSVAGINRTGHADADGKETVEVWECKENCPVSKIDMQSGICKGFRGGGIRRKKSSIMPSIVVNKDGANPNYYNDSGGASRFFKRVNP